ncbi:hypothetical protein GCM10022631_33980 [Deinococcus rubellus]|uniref:Uncharacterized protein n=1 Tax=Deinococcus rubellus TaxID=1889240 RepID=A0ABY5YDV5_9DEIO|nr:hypothetical protein [Deinococcus rubellus]UWX63116.1 hypothetical protein N0D28_10135 [Deinococcus rubellus]
MRLWSKALLVGLPLVTAGVMGALAQRLSPQSLPIALPSTLHCTEPPKFEVGYQGGENYLVVQNDTYRFQSTSWLQADLCLAGTLEMTAHGELAGDESPRLVAALDGQVLDTQPFTQERTWKLNVPASGRLILGYFNDYYLADVRVATLSRFRVSGPACQAVPQIDVPLATGGKWYPAANVATLVRGPALTAVPCGPGQLTFTLVGREGNHAFPQLSIVQAGKVLAQPVSQAQPQMVSLKVGASPITMTLTNPYGKTLADRNLIVTRLVFSPR